MSAYETKRDQYIHDHALDVTLSLHYVFEAAENRIAELEAENAELCKVSDKWRDLFTQAEAELAALISRECEGCEHDIEGVARQCERGVSVDGDIPSRSFACNYWAEGAK